jgi:hypothetical protein
VGATVERTRPSPTLCKLHQSHSPTRRTTTRLAFSLPRRMRISGGNMAARLREPQLPRTTNREEDPASRTQRDSAGAGRSTPRPVEKSKLPEWITARDRRQGRLFDRGDRALFSFLVLPYSLNDPFHSRHACASPSKLVGMAWARPRRNGDRRAQVRFGHFPVGGRLDNGMDQHRCIAR